MPGLIVFNRKWLMASDDLIFPFFVETAYRSVWFPAIPVMLYLHLRTNTSHTETHYITCILSYLLVDYVFNVLLCSVIAWYSAQGSVMEVDQRKILPKLLYIKLAFTVIETVSFVPITWFIFSSPNIDVWLRSDVRIFLEITCILFWLYCLCCISLVILSYDPTGSAKYWKDANLQAENSAQNFKKSKKMWALRLKFFCCCLDVCKSHSPVYEEVASFFATFFKDSNLVPSDTLAGLVILNKKHASERRRLKFLDSLYNHGYVSLNEGCPPSWMTVENGLYFLRLAKSTYGWPMFIDICNPFSLCVLASRLKCCYSTDIAGDDTCCYCNSAALQKITGYTNDDLIYVSYQNAVYAPAFFIALDRQKSCVVMCIRGTISLADLVTDIDGESEKVKLPNCPEFLCHRGALKSAKYLYKKLEELRILKYLFAEFPHFHLAITGHSLGGSAGSVLGLMLRPEYPDIRCYCYGPLAALSKLGAKLTYDFIFTVVVGEDMSPCLCIRSCVDLRSEVVKCLRESKMQKYRLLLGACSRSLPNDIGEPKNFHEILDDNNVSHQQVGSFSSAERLYAPGRILHLENTANGVRSSWKTGLHFRRIIVTKRITVDHQPHRIQKMLEYIEAEQNQQNQGFEMPDPDITPSRPNDLNQKDPYIV